jgi:hypothetical protein
MHVALNRAKYFITTKELPSQLASLKPSLIRRKLQLPHEQQQQYVQLTLF